MKKKKNDLEIDWVDSIDKDVSPEDQLKHKRHAKAVVKSKRTRKILFWSISSVALVSVLSATVAIQLSKPSKALIYWYPKINKHSFTNLKSSNNLIEIKINENQTINSTPEDLINTIVNNDDKQNYELIFSKYATFVNKNQNKNWSVQYENFVIDSVSQNTLFIDLVFREEGNAPIEFVVRNFPLLTSKKTIKYDKNNVISKENEFNDDFLNDLKKKILYKLFLPININDNFSKEKINKYKDEFKKYIEKINNLIRQNEQDFKSLIDISWLFNEQFKINDNLENMQIVSNFITETNNFYSPIIFTSPIEIKNFDTDDDSWKTNSILSFKARVITLSTHTEKLGKYKTQYGIYIKPNFSKDEIQFEVPLLFDKLK